MKYPIQLASRAPLGLAHLALPDSPSAQGRPPTSATPRPAAAVELVRVSASDVASWGVEPDDLSWIEAVDLPGVLITYLLAEAEGDPYVIRLKIPDGYPIGTHAHSTRAFVTVLQGTFLLGAGTTPDRSKLVAFPAGSYVVIPPDVPHFAWTDGETVIQMSGSAPERFEWRTPVGLRSEGGRVQGWRVRPPATRS